MHSNGGGKYMAQASGKLPPTREQMDAMHALYRQGGQEHQIAPHIVYDLDT